MTRRVTATVKLKCWSEHSCLFINHRAFVKHQNPDDGEIQSRIGWSTTEVSLQPLQKPAIERQQKHVLMSKCFLHFFPVSSEDFVHTGNNPKKYCNIYTVPPLTGMEVQTNGPTKSNLGFWFHSWQVPLDLEICCSSRYFWLKVLVWASLWIGRLAVFPVWS